MRRISKKKKKVLRSSGLKRRKGVVAAWRVHSVESSFDAEERAMRAACAKRIQGAARVNSLSSNFSSSRKPVL